MEVGEHGVGQHEVVANGNGVVANGNVHWKCPLEMSTGNVNLI